MIIVKSYPNNTKIQFILRNRIIIFKLLINVFYQQLSNFLEMTDFVEYNLIGNL